MANVKSPDKLKVTSHNTDTTNLVTFANSTLEQDSHVSTV